MAARKSSRVNRKYKIRYRGGNWPEYERGLRARGDVTIWFSDEAIAAWFPHPNGRRGGQPRYSNLAILTALTLRTVFHLPLRQTEGFVGSLLGLLGIELNAPDHTTLCRRGRDVEVPPLCRDHLLAKLGGRDSYPGGHASRYPQGPSAKFHVNLHTIPLARALPGAPLFELFRDTDPRLPDS